MRRSVCDRRRIRHSNVIERTFGETRRGAKGIGRLPGEVGCLPLIFTVLDCASTGWRLFTLTAEGVRLSQDLRRSVLDSPRQLRPQPANTEPGDQPQTVTAVA